MAIIEVRIFRLLQLKPVPHSTYCATKIHQRASNFKYSTPSYTIPKNSKLTIRGYLFRHIQVKN
jgi:hypothetical protein